MSHPPSLDPPVGFMGVGVGPAEKTSPMCDVCGLDVQVRPKNMEPLLVSGQAEPKSARSTTYSVVNRADLAVTTGESVDSGLAPCGRSEATKSPGRCAPQEEGHRDKPWYGWGAAASMYAGWT